MVKRRKNNKKYNKGLIVATSSKAVAVAMIVVTAMVAATSSTTTVSAAPTEGTTIIAAGNNNDNISSSSSLLLCDANLITIAEEEEEEELQREEFEIEIEMTPSESPSRAPPCSDRYSNARGVYTSAMAPCIITFHKNKNKNNINGPSSSTSRTNSNSNSKSSDSKIEDVDKDKDKDDTYYYYHGTSDVCGSENAIGELKEYVTMWPDECVGDFARCYDLQDHKTLLCPTLLRLLERGRASSSPLSSLSLSSSTSTSTFGVGSTLPDYDELFPTGTTHVSVDCTADKDVVMQNYERTASLQHDIIRDVVSAKKETTLFAVLSVLSSVLIVVYAISQLVVKPIVSAIGDALGSGGGGNGDGDGDGDSTGGGGGGDGQEGYHQDQEGVALVTTNNLRIDQGDATTELEEDVPQDENENDDDDDDDDTGNERGQYLRAVHIRADYEHFDSQIPMDFDAVPIVPAIIIPMEAIPAMVIQDGITYYS